MQYADAKCAAQELIRNICYELMICALQNQFYITTILAGLRMGIGVYILKNPSSLRAVVESQLAWAAKSILDCCVVHCKIRLRILAMRNQFSQRLCNDINSRPLLRKPTA